MDENYTEDPSGEEGSPDLFARILIDEEVYFESDVMTESVLPQRIPFENLSIQGVELDQTLVVRIFDHDDDSLEDVVGEVSFVPRDLMVSQPTRKALFGGYLQVDLLLNW